MKLDEKNMAISFSAQYKFTAERNMLLEKRHKNKTFFWACSTERNYPPKKKNEKKWKSINAVNEMEVKRGNGTNEGREIKRWANEQAMMERGVAVFERLGVVEWSYHLTCFMEC